MYVLLDTRPKTFVGQPEGAGGAQKLPQRMKFTGKNVRADKAKKLGLVDMPVDPLG